MSMISILNRVRKDIRAASGQARSVRCRYDRRSLQGTFESGRKQAIPRDDRRARRDALSLKKQVHGFGRDARERGSDNPIGIATSGTSTDLYT